MKKYKEYMDHVKVSDTLHQRLTELDAPKARPAVWKRYGAAAAALVLVAGLGTWGLGRTGVFAPAAEHGNPEIVPEGAVDAPDIALEDPNETLEPGMKTIGGYEVPNDGMVAYYMLPGIDYGMSDTRSELALDWGLPKGTVQRDLTQEDIAALFGGEENLSVHLGWEGYTLTGWAAWYEDGSFWGAFVNGYKGPMDYFELAFTAGDAYPPTCIYYGDGVVNELWDVPVTAWGCDRKDGGDRRVEFLHAGYGFRFDITASDADNACRLVSRLTRWIILEGLAADAITADGAAPVHPWEADPNYSVGEPNWNDGGMDTPAYDPDKAADPAYGAPVLDPSAGGQPGEESPALPDEVPEEDVAVHAASAAPGLWAEGCAMDDEADPNYSVGEPNWNDGGMDTPACDPDKAAGPN